MNTIDKLTSVLCDPSGKCCIAGSDADRAIIDGALRELLAQQPGTVSEWVGLTVAEIFDADPCPSVMFDEERIDFARAIETKLKEKNT